MSEIKLKFLKLVKISSNKPLMVKAILVLSEKGGEYKFAYDFKVYNFNRYANNLKVSYLKLLGSWPKESEDSF